MIVDDDRDVVTVMKKALEREDCQVHAFTEPVKALAHAKDCKQCGIVVTDVRMPGMNGFQLVRALKELRPDVKVVVMTAFQINSEEWQRILPSTKVDQFLIKPVTVSKLLATIEKCMGRVASTNPPIY